MTYFRIHTADIAYVTQQPRGLFTAVGKLVDAKLLTESETAEYWKQREYFEEVLPVPPFYAEGNPDRAITWFKDTPQGNGIFAQLTFYRDICKKYGVQGNRRVVFKRGRNCRVGSRAPRLPCHRSAGV